MVLHTFHGGTADMDALSIAFAVPLEGIRFVKIVTAESPSWVSWREIEVMAGEEGSP